MAKKQTTRGNPIAENMWLLAGLVCLFSGVVLVVARFLADKDGIPIWSIVVLFVAAAISLLLSDIYAHIVNVVVPKSAKNKEQEAAAAPLQDVTEMEPDNEMEMANQVGQQGEPAAEEPAFAQQEPQEDHSEPMGE